MPTRTSHGMLYTLARSDGELLGVEIEDRDEALEWFDELDPDITDADLIDHARDRVDTSFLIDWTLEPLWSQYGLRGPHWSS